MGFEYFYGFVVVDTSQWQPNLFRNGKEVATQKMDHTIPLILKWDETFDIGADTGTPVDDEDYQVPFTFTGKLNKLTIKIDRPQLTPSDIKLLEEQGQRNNRDSE